MKRRLNESLSDDQKEMIKEMVAADFECGMPENDFDSLVELLEDDECFGAGEAGDGAEYYMELLNCGPEGIIDEIGEDYFSEDYLAQYGYNSLEESTKIKKEYKTMRKFNEAAADEIAAFDKILKRTGDQMERTDKIFNSKLKNVDLRLGPISFKVGQNGRVYCYIYGEHYSSLKAGIF